MSKSPWIFCVAAVSALAASSLSAEPPPFPDPKPPTGTDPAQPEGTSPDKKGEEKAEPDVPRDAMPPADEAGQPPAGEADARAAKHAKSDLAWVRFKGETLKFEQSRFQGEARLFARARNEGPWEVFRGQDLETILRANPNLATHPELPALREQVAGPATARLVVQGFNIGYEEDLGKGKAKLFARTPQGERMWTGQDLTAIAAENRDVAQLPEWLEFEPRVRSATAVTRSVQIRPGASGVAILTFAPREVTVALHQWRDRGWQSRSYRGLDLPRIVRGNRDLSGVLDIGEVSEFGYPATPTAPPGAPPYTAPASNPPRATTPAPAPAPRPTYPPSAAPPAGGGGGSACGAGGKNCGGR